MRDTKISNASSPLIDARYALGDCSRGFDCLNSILHFYGKMGVELPKSFKGWTESNYAVKFAKNPGEGRRVLYSYLMSLGTEVELTHFRNGDLMIFQHLEDPPFPGIYLGATNVLIITGKEHGAKVFALQTIKNCLGELISVRRLIS